MTSVRVLVDNVLQGADEPLTLAEVHQAIGGAKVAPRMNVSEALGRGLRTEQYERSGEPRHYRYRLARDAGDADNADGAPALPPVVAPDSAPEVRQTLFFDAMSSPSGFAASIGTVCALPQNAAQGTIEQALRALLQPDAPLTLANILEQLPKGWSRTDAISALNEGVHSGWVAFKHHSYVLVGEPPAMHTLDLSRVALSASQVTAIAHFNRDRAVAIRANLADLLGDAYRSHQSFPALSAIAQAGEHVDRAIALLTD